LNDKGTRSKGGHLFQKILAIVKPNVKGGQGVGEQVQVLLTTEETNKFQAFLRELTKLEGFSLKEKKKMSNKKGSLKHFPYNTNGSYPRTRFTLSFLEDIEKIFEIFSNIKPQTKVIWFRDTNKPSFCFAMKTKTYDILTKGNQLDSYLQDKYPGRTLQEEKSFLVAGTKKGRQNYFHFTFTNYSPDISGSILHLSFGFEGELDGKTIDPAGKPKSVLKVEDIPQIKLYTVDDHPYSKKYVDCYLKSQYTLEEMLALINKRRISEAKLGKIPTDFHTFLK